MYDDDGRRVPFDPLRVARRIPGCLLCGRRVAAVGIFCRLTAEMRAVVMRLRAHPVLPRTSSCISYGLCRRHLARPNVTDRVEAALALAAARVVSH